MIVAFSVAPSGQPADSAHLPGDADTASVHRAVAAAVAPFRRENRDADRAPCWADVAAGSASPMTKLRMASPRNSRRSLCGSPPFS